MIYKVDKSNAQLTRVGRAEFEACQSITFDDGGNLFGLSSSEEDTIHLFNLDTVNVNAKLFCSTGYTNVTALAINGIVITDITDDLVSSLPREFILEQNHPNPFNQRTIINYELPIKNYVKLGIYNILGQKVAMLVSEKKLAGHHYVEFNGQNLPSGIYLYRITAGKWQDVKKMVLLK
jgi:hypothetical protein